MTAASPSWVQVKMRIYGRPQQQPCKKFYWRWGEIFFLKDTMDVWWDSVGYVMESNFYNRKYRIWMYLFLFFFWKRLESPTWYFDAFYIRLERWWVDFGVPHFQTYPITQPPGLLMVCPDLSTCQGNAQTPQKPKLPDTRLFGPVFQPTAWQQLYRFLGHQKWWCRHS